MESFSLEYLWLIPLFPLLAFVVIFLFTRPLPRISAYISILAIIASLVVSAWALMSLVVAFLNHAAGAELVKEVTLTWFKAGPIEFPAGLVLDPLTAMMLIVVTVVSFLVQIFSQGYMVEEDEHGHLRKDPGYGRYFAFISLFTTSMLLLVLANNFLQIYIAWELVGLCSYLLIGFWYHKPSAASAAKKAFLTTRLGDLGLLIGILIIYFTTHSFVFTEVEHAIKLGELSGGLLTIAMIGVFLGAVGKSAQFPLHVWLPDAMEGPTPVSALIHAATMVAAGVYLVARTFEMFAASPDQQALMIVAYVGGFTAIFAASMGLVMNDIKKVMAYSTISQLGYMMMGLGVGAYAAGVFHLFNHAFFKALLFLGSGSVIYAAHHEQDMRKMGGLGKKMPITFVTMTFAGLALAGIPPFSGFWSKDEILAGAYEKNMLLYVMGAVAAFFTAFYIFRAIFLTFTGENRAHSHDAHGAHASHSTNGHDSHSAHPIKESPWVMTIPLIVLGIASLFSGFLGSPLMGNAFQSFIEKGAEMNEGMNYTVMISSVIIAVAGIVLSSLIYYFKVIPATLISGPMPWLHAFVLNKYGMDDLYQWIIDKIVLGLCSVALWFDQHIVDGIVNGVATIISVSGGKLRKLETGRVPNYGLAIFAGALVISGILILTGSMP